MGTRRKQILFAIISAVVGYGLYYFLIVDWAGWILGSYLGVYLLVLIGTIFGIYFCLNFFFSDKPSKITNAVLIVCYAGLAFYAFFYRSSFSGMVAVCLNPLVAVQDMMPSNNPYYWQAILEAALNLLFAAPFAVILGKLSAKRFWAVGALTAVAIELIQMVFKLGMLDTFDIILYLLGMALGRGVYRLGKKYKTWHAAKN